MRNSPGHVGERPLLDGEDAGIEKALVVERLSAVLCELMRSDQLHHPCEARFAGSGAARTKEAECEQRAPACWPVVAIKDSVTTVLLGIEELNVTRVVCREKASRLDYVKAASSK